MEERIGKVTHYFGRISVAVLELSGDLAIGEKILIIGKNTDLMQAVTSMEIEHHKVQSVKPGMEVALQVAEPVHQGDEVYKIIENEAK